MMDSTFHDLMASGYSIAEPGLVIGSPRLGDVVDGSVRIEAALALLNRHGLIAGATGTGKTRTLQVLSGQASLLGIPAVLADVKGDLTGIAAPGDPVNPEVGQRASRLSWTVKPAAHPAQLLSLSGVLGAPVRATVHSFGPCS